MLGKKIGIDLGTTAARLHVRGDATVSSDPSAVAVDASNRVVATGMAAQRLADRPGVTLHAPLRDGEISDHLAAEALLVTLIGRACGRQRIFRPDVMVSVPPRLGGADRRFLLEVCARAGARTMYLIDSPLAAALGAGLAVSTGIGRLVVDVGAGTVDAAVIAAEGMVSAASSTRGAARLTADVAAYLGGLLDVDIAMSDAEEVKREIGSAVVPAEERTLRLCGRRHGAEVEVVVSSTAVHVPVRSWVTEITALVQSVIDDCPRRLVRDVRERTGLTLCGGGAQLHGLERHLAAALRLPVSLAGEPGSAAARGAGAALENLDVLRRTFLYVR